MNKLTVAILLILLLPLAGYSQSGKLKISLTGINCIDETMDNALETDGKGDEIFLQACIMILDQSGSIKYQTIFTGPTMGDINGFPSRLKAGTRSSTGGIKQYDNFSTNIIISECNLAATDVLVIIPTLWEWDEGPAPTLFSGYFNTHRPEFQNYIRTNLPLVDRTPSGWATFVDRVTSHTITTGTSCIDAGSVLLAQNRTTGCPGTRVIGTSLEGGGTGRNYINPNVLFLRPSFIPTLANSNAGLGTGVVHLESADDKTGLVSIYDKHSGDYKFYLKLEWSPDKALPTVSLDPNSIPAVRNTQSIPENVNGNWNGSFNVGNSPGQVYWNYTFNPDGTMVVTRGDNSTYGKGSFTLNGSNFNAQLILSSNNLRMDLVGSLVGNKLSGTWKDGSGYTGTWTLARK